MIDCHCHLEQPDYDDDSDEVIENCRKHLQAVITSCAHPKDFELTTQLVKEYEGFVFATVGIHPKYICEISEKQKNEYFDLLRARKEYFVGIGETGLDYFWVKNGNWREKQVKLFIEFICFLKIPFSDISPAISSLFFTIPWF